MLLMAATVTVTYSNPKPTPYSNADSLNIVVQHEKKEILPRNIAQ